MNHLVLPVIFLCDEGHPFGLPLDYLVLQMNTCVLPVIYVCAEGHPFVLPPAYFILRKNRLALLAIYVCAEDKVRTKRKSSCQTTYGQNQPDKARIKPGQSGQTHVLSIPYSII